MDTLPLAEDALEAYHRGLEYLDYNEPDQAIAAFTQAIELRPGAAHFWLARGYAHAVLGNPQKAVNDYTQAIVIDPGFAAAYCNRSAALREAGNLSGAEADRQEYARLTEGDLGKD